MPGSCQRLVAAARNAGCVWAVEEWRSHYLFLNISLRPSCRKPCPKRRAGIWHNDDSRFRWHRAQNLRAAAWDVSFFSSVPAEFLERWHSRACNCQAADRQHLVLPQHLTARIVPVSNRSYHALGTTFSQGIIKPHFLEGPRPAEFLLADRLPGIRRRDQASVLWGSRRRSLGMPEVCKRCVVKGIETRTRMAYSTQELWPE